MPQIANVSLTDVNETIVYKPAGLQNGVAQFRGTPINSYGYAAAQTQLSLSALLPTKTSKVRKVRMKLVYPIVSVGVADLDVPKVIRSVSFDGTFFLPETSTFAERASVLAQMRDLINEELMKQLVVDLESIY